MFINNSIITYPIAFSLHSFDFNCVYVCVCVGCLMTKGKQTKKCEIKAQSKTFSSINFTRIDLYWQLVIPNDMKSAQVERKKNKHLKRKITCNTRLICFKWCSVKEYPNSQWCKDCYGLRTTLFDVFAWSYLWLVICVRTTVKSIN